MIWKYFLPFCGLAFQSLDNVLCMKVFNFYDIQLAVLFLAVLEFESRPFALSQLFCLFYFLDFETGSY